MFVEALLCTSNLQLENEIVIVDTVKLNWTLLKNVWQFIHKSNNILCRNLAYWNINNIISIHQPFQFWNATPDKLTTRRSLSNWIRQIQKLSQLPCASASLRQQSLILHFQWLWYRTVTSYQIMWYAQLPNRWGKQHEHVFSTTLAPIGICAYPIIWDQVLN